MLISTLIVIEGVVVLDQELQGLLVDIRVNDNWEVEELSLSYISLLHNDAELERRTLSQVGLQEAHDLVEFDLFFSTKDILQLTV